MSTTSVLAVVILAIVSLMVQNTAEEWMSNSNDVKLKAIEVFDMVQLGESNLRGYLLTNDTSYMQPFSTMKIAVKVRLEDLKQLTTDNPVQLANLAKFVETSNAKFDLMDRTYRAQHLGDSATALQLINNELGEQLMDSLKTIKEELIEEEDRLLLERRTDNKFFLELSLLLLILAIFLAIYSIYKLYRRVGPLIDSLNSANYELQQSIAEKSREIELRKKLEARNRQLIDRLTAKNEELNHFAYIASHDLQEPLRTVDNFIEVFKEDYCDKLDDKAHQYFDFINGATGRMKALITGLLNYSRLGKSRGAEPIDLNQLLDGVKGNLAAAIKAKKVELHIGEMPKVVCMKTETAVLFQNLINNAIKYTAANVRPNVTVLAQEMEDRWQFSVADNGIGIAVNHQSKIFNMFSRLHGDGEYQGQGIGLAFCKKIVELHGGSIWVESVPGQGSTFYFTISKKLKDEAEIEQNTAD